MLLFKRILKFKREFLAKLRDKRKAERYAVGQRFPLKATINLTGQESAGAATVTGYDWGGRVINVSSNGVGLQLLRAATTVRGEKSELRLSLEDHELSIPCVVAHFRTFSGYSLCGLALKFTDFNVQKAYLQLVEAVRMGASFAPLKSKGGPSRPGLVAERFSADNRAMLVAWRAAKGGELDGFEMAVGDHCLKGGNTVPPLAVFRMSKPPKTETSAEVAGEVRRLFRWVVPNLPKAIPNDLRSLMERVAGSRSAGEAIAGGSVRASAPPTEWQRPNAKR